LGVVDDEYGEKEGITGIMLTEPPAGEARAKAKKSNN
jgi:hypothetical protein